MSDGPNNAFLSFLMDQARRGFDLASISYNNGYAEARLRAEGSGSAGKIRMIVIEDTTTGNPIAFVPSMGTPSQEG